MTARTWRLLGGLLVVVLLALVAPQVLDTADPDPTSDPGGTSGPGASDECAVDLPGLPRGTDVVVPEDLPAEAREVLDDIDAGGPFVAPGKDGSIFGNREGLLPDQPRGWYREYTVPTPGEDDRGARRIVTGGDPVETSWWTDDHYASFALVARCPDDLS